MQSVPLSVAAPNATTQDEPSSSSSPSPASSSVATTTTPINLSTSSNSSSCERQQSSISSSSSVLTNSSAPDSPSSGSLTSMPPNSPTSRAATAATVVEANYSDCQLAARSTPLASSNSTISTIATTNTTNRRADGRSNSHSEHSSKKHQQQQQQRMPMMLLDTLDPLDTVDAIDTVVVAAAVELFPVELATGELGQLAGPSLVSAGAAAAASELKLEELTTVGVDAFSRPYVASPDLLNEATIATATASVGTCNKPTLTEVEPEITATDSAVSTYSISTSACIDERPTAVGSICVSGEINRLERSNSCGQVEGVASALASAATISVPASGAGTAFDAGLVAALPADATPTTAIGAHSCGLSGVVSVSHENLQLTEQANEFASALTILNQTLDSSSSVGHLCESVGAVEPTTSFQQEAHAVLLAEPEIATVVRVAPTPSATQQQQQSSFSSSRFFSSKLNTGSLWSLLSVGSSTSEMAFGDSTVGDSAAEQSNDKLGNNKQDGAKVTPVDNVTPTSSTTSGFFSRVNFKRQTQPAQTTRQQTSISSSNKEEPKLKTTHPIKTTATTFSAMARSDHLQQQQASIERKRVRFNVKYIGSAILHRNFTLPMLEWIAKDIRRQTVKGGQSIGQRQFTIPTRDIVLEIQSYQLTAISCKDGYPLFVHPMHCVSKYAQLQYDSTCFAYLIRDTKDSPCFCHVFQAKSANKVHDIFTAIREATTRTHQQQQPPNFGSSHAQPELSFDQSGCILAAATATGSVAGNSMMMQYSASTDSQMRSYAQDHLNSNNQANLFPPTTPPLLSKQPSLVKPLMLPSLAGVGISPSNVATAAAVASVIPTTAGGRSHMTIAVGHQPAAQTSSSQFEDSYQFEVMFVKKVKLQCRRVPASFVDDALETLKSFEVLKGGGESKAAQIKAGMGKRIISASVDERQEYDESCQSPTPSSQSKATAMMTDFSHLQKVTSYNGAGDGNGGEQSRRGSSVSLHRQEQGTIKEDPRESRSCQQSPTSRAGSRQSSSSLLPNRPDLCSTGNQTADDSSTDQHCTSSAVKKHHQSMDCLKSIDSTIRSAKEGNVPNYTNDFSPYNTITSTDLNERIAAIPVVSSSVSLDHETRQKLARQVRETIMATAASIKKGVYASGDKLDSSSSSKALDSLSCTASSSVLAIDDIKKSPPSNLSTFEEAQQQPNETTTTANDKRNYKDNTSWSSTTSSDYRRSSNGCDSAGGFSQQSANNFDLFRRASARQVVKNRTMLLLIGKEELCTISIDKHQMLFSKSFSSIVHCLQGINNKDHFGLICRDSGKINPSAESYAGFIFKCQSDKVVREIMGALKQVIYSSQHNYHGYNSPYNPLNAAATQYNASKRSSSQSPKMERSQQVLSNHQQHLVGSTSVDTRKQQQQHQVLAALSAAAAGGQKAHSSAQMSLSAKRGFLNPIEVEEAARHNKSTFVAATTAKSVTDGTASVLDSSPPSHLFHQIPLSAPAIVKSTHQQQPKNLIKSMFCDDCPLYWYHRLCCDIESLPAEASKAIILRRIDSSLTDKEQDELYSRFSEFDIESINEHNEIFMSLLRHQCERKQLRHNQSQSHLNAMAKNLESTKTAAAVAAAASSAPTGAASSCQRHFMIQKGDSTSTFRQPNATSGGHQRSGSTSGSLAFVIGQSNANHTGQSIADASSMAIDNLKRAKNSISVSIENILKRRSSMRDEQQAGQSEDETLSTNAGLLPSRAGSFRAPSRGARTANEQGNSASDSSSNLKRSQSTTDYSNGSQWNRQQRQQQQHQGSKSSWKDSLSRTINDDLTNPLVGLFRRRSSTFGSKSVDVCDNDKATDETNRIRASAECLSHQLSDGSSGSPSSRQPVSPGLSQESRFMFANSGTGGSSPSSVLSSAFWKKSIFDKIRQPVPPTQTTTTSERNSAHSSPQPPLNSTDKQPAGLANNKQLQAAAVVVVAGEKPKRSQAELRLLWKKAIAEQITLLKMDRQNQRLQANAAECDIQRIKLNYRDVSYAREVLPHWDKLLKQDPTKKVEFVEIACLVRLGIPKQRRGEIWMFLMNQYQLRHGTSFQPADSEYKGDANQTYRSLLSQLSVQQHDIFVDIGRTFPTHPYYSQYLSIGQLSLFNLLKAYSLLDQEVGYCQGLSFVAGILLLHVNIEDEAFELMRHLLFNFGLRKQYLPSMNALHLQLYQITRLLRDHEYDLFNHFDHYDISPSLYAAPWFLTLFASQFPLGFVARLLDLVFLIGIEAIFRVSLNLLAYHRTSIIARQSLEATMEFMRNDLVNIEDKNLVEIFDKSMSLDLRNKLIEYEIEYTFYCAEDKARSTAAGNYSTATYPPAPSIPKTNTSHSKSPGNSDNNNTDQTDNQEDNSANKRTSDSNMDSSTSIVADATATIIIQHLLANNHLKSLRSNYSY